VRITARSRHAPLASPLRLFQARINFSIGNRKSTALPEWPTRADG